MTARALPRSRLGNLIPSLVEAQALVALVPATGELPWAAAAAWDVARAAAQHGRRVALVDLWIEDPKLHEIVGLTPAEGIVDAFEYGVSLTKAAHQVDGVFFIAAGAYTAHAGDLFGHERWRKLHGGFRVEGALLLLYLSAGALARLSAVPDGLIVLSPDGFEPESSIGQGITAALERGTPLLGVVRERWTPVSAAPPSGTRPTRPARPARRRTRPIVVAATLAVGAGGGWVLLVRGAEHRSVAPASQPPAPPAAPAGDSAPAPRVDTLPWTVQLAAYGTLEKALALADRLAADDLPAFVTPVALERQNGAAAVWYRVVAGAFATRDSAAAARAALWERELASPGQGDLLRAPYSFSLPDGGHPDSLRARGLPAVRWGPGNALLLGAFETAEQASLAAAQLKRAGITATLVTRVRTTP
ncbi:MAG TPA: SPOR domain-containing protein [Gemmatimonadales bacterium]|nr:SPOR domain-containing protein [Gemmatimonadales bacterium]